MATKKKTTSKGRGGKARPKKAGAKKTAKKAGKKTAKKAGKKTARKPAKKGWITINPGLASQGRIRSDVSRWPRRKPQAAKTPAAPRTYVVNPGLPTQTRHLLPSGSSEHPLVKAYEKAGGTPPGYVRSGTLVGAPGGGFKSKKASARKAKKASKKASSKRGGKKSSLSKEDFLKRMQEGRAAAAKKAGGKKGGKKAAKKAKASKKAKAATKKSHAKKTSPARAASAKQRAHAPSKKRRSSRRKGWPRVGAHKRTFGIAKFKAMNAARVPSTRVPGKKKRLELRQAAGRGITAKEIFNMAEATGMKAWVCAGMRRTGCGGGSKMLRGSHQIGVFGVGPKS